jgi:hypothetical protein
MLSKMSLVSRAFIGCGGLWVGFWRSARRDLRVEHGRIKLGMSEQNLDQTHSGVVGSCAGALCFGMVAWAGGRAKVASPLAAIGPSQILWKSIGHTLGPATAQGCVWMTLWPSCDTTTGHSSMVIDMHFGFAISLALALLAIVGLFVEIPFVSSYAFWVMTAAYLILASSVKVK